MTGVNQWRAKEMTSISKYWGHVSFHILPSTRYMLKGPKCNLNFSFLRTLGPGEGRKKSHVQRKLGKHLAYPKMETRTGSFEDRSRLARACSGQPPSLATHRP